jgi:Protein of unknown function (DUF3306)
VTTRDEGEAFLSRWSRLKTELREAEKPPEPKPDAAPAQPPAKSSEPPAPELPPLDSLKGLASEYTEFLKPGVDESLRRSALKKLFKDPYFETFERFAEYCEDYTKGEPIPAAMLKTLEHAKRLLFDENKEEESAAAKDETQAEAKAPAAPPQPEEKS